MFKKPVVEAGGINIREMVVVGGLRRRKRRLKHPGLRHAVEMGAVGLLGFIFFSSDSPQQERLGTIPSVT
jgi:hypothetical protein